MDACEMVGPDRGAYHCLVRIAPREDLS